jgi:hypothetical protein
MPKLVQRAGELIGSNTVNSVQGNSRIERYAEKQLLIKFSFLDFSAGK